MDAGNRWQRRRRQWAERRLASQRLLLAVSVLLGAAAERRQSQVQHLAELPQLRRRSWQDRQDRRARDRSDTTA